MAVPAEIRPSPGPYRSRVLVAEDDAALRRLLELRLGVDGYEVRTVPDGADALAMFETWPPDILICDVMMPKVSGLSVCKEIRTHEEFAHIPIVLLTARVFDEDIEDVVRLGGITFMSKPFNASQLNVTLAALLDPPQTASVESSTDTTQTGQHEWLRVNIDAKAENLSQRRRT